MDVTVTGVPDDVFQALEQAAAANGRSLNSEIIARLEGRSQHARGAGLDSLQRIRETRDRLAGITFDHEAIDAIKRAGRA
ncbi:MAG: FitA-like ribbon-helix-helix domain-containing protein [Gammaproteobacteria bacterium]